MATARERVSRVVPTDIELVASEAPQYVNEEGFEVDAQTFAAALLKVSADLETQQEKGLGQAIDMEASGIESFDNIIAEADPLTGVSDLENVTANAEPLLSLAESNVLHYSVVAARQHHLQNLLPHIFSHPPIPANSRPRTRPPPKSTFLYPTPPPLVHPLPHREYHAPTTNTKKKTEIGSPAPDGTEVAESKRRKNGRNKGKSKADESEGPAHEIECIARVTLSIGPISFPETEIWVGRFVQPRAAAPKPPRAKKIPGERKKADGNAQAAHARASNTPLYGQSGHAGSNVRPPTGPPYTGYRPRPPHPSTLPTRPPPAPRAELSPDLIKRVNEAATQHSWLSQIIHKAARSQATKEELAKLGRVVNRLKEGKDIGEGADDLPTTSNQAGPSQAPIRPPPATAQVVPSRASSHGNSQEAQADTTADSPGSGSLTPAPDDGSDGDSDVDMKGPQQVGGGYPDGVDPDREVLNTTPTVPTSVPPLQQPQMSSPWISQHPSQYQTSGPSQPLPYASAQARDSSSFASSPPSSATISRTSGVYQPHPGAYAAYGISPPLPGSVNQHNLAGTGMPPPPRPTYHLPPPFLLVAFKEAPTEKFQLPLGSLSYISRVGEKEETDETPISSASDSTPAPAPLVPTVVSLATGSTVASRKPTRASLSKEKLSSPPPIKFDAPKSEIEQTPKITNPRLSPDLPRLSGASPSNGTVLISTFVPRLVWEKPDWEDLATRLPFGNPLFERPVPTTNQVKVESSPEPHISSGHDSPQRSMEKSRSASEAHNQPGAADDPLPVKGKLLNLATESFFPEDGAVHAVTIRLSDVTDQTWQRLKTINGMATTAEMKSLGEHSPHLMPKEDPAVAAPVGQAPRIPPFQPSPELRLEYSARKKTFFRRMLTRVPARKFLRYRLPDYRPDLVEATSDKWGPRPYPISTKALYNRDGEYDGQPISLSPVQPKRGNKRAVEPDVTFELPVSLDQLDEVVAENARKGKKGKGMDGRKRSGKRWIAGTVCEGCGKGDQRVWRSGPGGPRTLCNECGDKFKAKELGPLVAPGAAHPGRNTANQAPNDEPGQTDEPATTATEVPEVRSPVQAPDTTPLGSADQQRPAPDAGVAEPIPTTSLQTKNTAMPESPSQAPSTLAIMPDRPPHESENHRPASPSTAATKDLDMDRSAPEAPTFMATVQPSGPSTADSATS